jgi:transcriptional regulator with XRE-family HTH domain
MDTMPQRSEVMERIGKKLRQLRDERFLSRAELAEKAGVSPATIAQRRTIRKLAQALGVEPQELVEE